MPKTRYEAVGEVRQEELSGPRIHAPADRNLVLLMGACSSKKEDVQDQVVVKRADVEAETSPEKPVVVPEMEGPPAEQSSDVNDAGTRTNNVVSDEVVRELCEAGLDPVDVARAVRRDKAKAKRMLKAKGVKLGWRSSIVRELSSWDVMSSRSLASSRSTQLSERTLSTSPVKASRSPAHWSTAEEKTTVRKVVGAGAVGRHSDENGGGAGGGIGTADLDVAPQLEAAAAEGVGKTRGETPAMPTDGAGGSAGTAPIDGI